MPAKYVRFCLNDGEGNAEGRGLLSVAYAYLEEDSASSNRERIGELVRWFELNLPVPQRFNRTRSKGFYRRETKGLSWFKDEATAHISAMRELATCLEQDGYSVAMLRTSRPGYVIYEDEHQLIAEPFEDT